MGDALSAEYAVRVFEIAVIAHVHGGPGAGARHVPDVHALDFVADLDAAHALDALAGLPDNGDAQVHVGALRLDLIGLVVDVQVVGELLELTVAAPHTNGTVGIVLGENQPEVRFPGVTHSRGVGVNHHALQDFRVAGGDQALRALHLHHAHAAGGDLVQLLQIAQVGNGDARLFRRVQDGGPLGGGQLPAVDCKVYHFSTRPPLKIP